MLNYENSGVSLQKASELDIMVAKTLESNKSLFCSLYEHPYLKEYSLASCCDGIGTKIIPLLKSKDTKCIAQDLVAMNLNDLVCSGAFPLFFLDYIAIHSLDVDLVKAFIRDLNSILKEYKCSLLGGETSELNDLLYESSMDIAGFAVGMVKKEDIIGAEKVNEEDVIIGLQSSGVHSNGFSLLRHLNNQGIINNALFEKCLAPTTIYVREILELCEHKLINAAANITGGGIEQNLKRVIPSSLTIDIDFNKIPEQEIFQQLKQSIAIEECYKVFNMGVGFCIIAPQGNIDKIMNICKKYNPFILGNVIKK